MPTDLLIPEALEEFVRHYVRSLEHLQVLLWLHDRSEREWSARAVESELRLPYSSAAYVLEDLCRKNLLDVRVGALYLLFRYRPATATEAGMVEMLAHAYREHPGELVALLSAQAVDRIKGSGVETFADAIRFGRKRTDV